MSVPQRIECSVTFLSASEGGRLCPFPAGALSGDGYRPHLVIGDPTQRKPVISDGDRPSEEYLGVSFHKAPLKVEADTAATVVLALIYEPRIYEKLKPGVAFTIREGAKVVGYGTVLRWLGVR